MKGLCCDGELNHRKDFMNKCHRIASVTESLLKILFVFVKILLTKLVLKRLSASPGWEVCTLKSFSGFTVGLWIENFKSWKMGSFEYLCVKKNISPFVWHFYLPTFNKMTRLCLISSNNCFKLFSDKGKLFMCGWNNKGQLGLSDTEDRQILCHVQGLSCVKTVSCGWNHTLAVTGNTEF